MDQPAVARSIKAGHFGRQPERDIAASVQEGIVSRLVQMGARKLPTMLGTAILTISLVGLTAAALGLSLTVGAELLSAAVGMAIGSRYA
jgi:hypothetical protein